VQQYDGQAKGQGDAHEANANVRERGCQHSASATPENQPKSSNELCCKLSGLWHSRLLSFYKFFPRTPIAAHDGWRENTRNGRAIKPMVQTPVHTRYNRAHLVRTESAGDPSARVQQLGEMMLSILVCHSYFLRLDQKQIARAKPYPPLATLQVVSLLREAGHQVSFFDAMLAEGIEEYHQLLASEAPQLVLFYEDNFNFLSKMCLATMRRAACDMIGSARHANARVIAAGPDVSDAPGPYLRAGADLALVGEGLT